MLAWVPGKEKTPIEKEQKESGNLKDIFASNLLNPKLATYTYKEHICLIL